MIVLKIDILGTKYIIQHVNAGKDKTLEENNWCGYCSNNPKKIVILNLESLPDWEKELPEVRRKAENTTLRHEIIHAFLNESGLQYCSFSPQSWARNEEMVDWIAVQFPKMLKAFKECDCLES